MRVQQWFIVTANCLRIREEIHGRNAVLKSSIVLEATRLYYGKLGELVYTGEKVFFFRGKNVYM